MKCLRRNLRQFEYYRYTGLESDLDENDLHTGIPKPIYEGPDGYKGNISTPSGSVMQTFAGLEEKYSRVIIMDEPNVGIDETGYIKIDGEEYDVVAVRPSLNYVAIAIRQRIRDHSEYDDDPIEPVDPGDEPIEPVDPGDEPIEPIDPGDEPVEPGDEPVEPGDEPVEPGEEPGEPDEPGGDEPFESGEGPEGETGEPGEESGEGPEGETGETGEPAEELEGEGE